ncbi:hypothetical protein BLOT_001161 [Blomia tropicalis]|nr:hypothetical protein BLOT_001161 [Blomia tropicalis]
MRFDDDDDDGVKIGQLIERQKVGDDNASGAYISFRIKESDKVRNGGDKAGNKPSTTRTPTTTTTGLLSG